MHGAISARFRSPDGVVSSRESPLSRTKTANNNIRPPARPPAASQVDLLHSLDLEHPDYVLLKSDSDLCSSTTFHVQVAPHLLDLPVNIRRHPSRAPLGSAVSGHSRAVGDPAHAAVGHAFQGSRTDSLHADLYIYTLYVGIHTTVSDRRVLLTIRCDTLY